MLVVHVSESYSSEGMYYKIKWKRENEREGGESELTRRNVGRTWETTRDMRWLMPAEVEKRTEEGMCHLVWIHCRCFLLLWECDDVALIRPGSAGNLHFFPRLLHPAMSNPNPEKVPFIVAPPLVAILSAFPETTRHDFSSSCRALLLLVPPLS